MKITAIIPTLNEEIHIEAAIKSVDFADEIIVVDSFSTDATIDLAKKYKVRIVQRVFDDFSTQKNFAIQLAKNNWIFLLDADERITADLRKEILEIDFEKNKAVGFYIRRTFYLAGKKIRFSGFQRDKVIRLFDKRYCKYNGVPVHELIEATGEIAILNSRIDHYSYRNFDHYISKIKRNACLQAENLHRQNKKVTAYHLYVKPPVRFVIHYVIRLGFLDGFAGFLIAKIHAYGVLERYRNLKRLNKKLK